MDGAVTHLTDRISFGLIGAGKTKSKPILVYSDSDTGMMRLGTRPISLPVRKFEQHVMCAIIANIFTISKHHHNGHRLHHTDTDNRKKS